VALDLALGGVGEFPASPLKIPSDLTLCLALARRYHRVKQPAQ